MNEDANEAPVIFIMGIMPRSGTHFLANLLCKHADCEKSVIPEDCFLQRADYLSNYGISLKQAWDQQGKFEGYSDYKELLLKNIGDGLIKFLREVKELSGKKRSDGAIIRERQKLLVTKTPYIDNISSFFKLFPDGKLILIVRDGRDLVESVVKSFDNNYNNQKAIRGWALAAKRIRRFEENHKRKQHLVVKYEDLHTNTEAEMSKVLNFLGLDIERYDFAAALNLPVVGSSEFKRGGGAVHWLPVKKTDEFRPLERSANWNRAQHERFNWLAKNELIYFGYEPKEFAGNKTVWKLWNHVMDFSEWIKTVPGKLMTQTSRGLKKSKKASLSTEQHI